MKNLKYLFLILTIAFTSVACETYDDYNVDRETVVGFTRRNLNINRIGDTGSTKDAQVTIFASEASSVDRTFNITDIQIDNPDEFLPTDPENFTYDSTVFIPAGELTGVITVTGINVTLTSERTHFRLIVEESPGVVRGSEITIGLSK